MSTPEPPNIPHDRLRACLETAGFESAFGEVAYEFVGRFSNEVWRLDLDNGVRIIAKHPYRPLNADDAPDVERSFYRFCQQNRAGEAPLNLPVPRYIGEIDGTLLLEYHRLEPFTFRQSVADDHAVAAIDALADWHGSWWNRAPDEPWLPNYADPALRRRIQDNYDAAWRRHGARLVEFAPEFEDLGNALVGRMAATVAPMATPATLIHGDAHAENIPLSDGRALLLDWQDPRIANPGFDLAVFTTMSYLEEDRLAAERPLVMRHAKAIRDRGCDWPEPWQDYRLGLLRRVAGLAQHAGIEFISLPWVFRRSAIAAVDHDVGELIR